MDLGRPHPPRVSRETRLLLSTALLAVIALWILARVRFPDQPRAATPVQPLFTQLGTRATFDDLAAEIAQLRPRVEYMLVGSALRVRSDAALKLLEQHEHLPRVAPDDDVIGLDPASRLALVRVPALAAPPPAAWSPSDPYQPRYLIATDTSAGALALRPVLVTSLVEAPTPLWPDPIWIVPSGTGLVPGSFVFTTDALLAGLVVDLSGRTGIVPGAVLLAEANRLLTPSVSVPGGLGIETQALTPPIAKATGATTGVVVTWVDPTGPAADALAPGDVLESADGEPLATLLHWRAWTSRMPAGKETTVRVRRRGEVHDVALVAAPASTLPSTSALGLTLQNVPGRGSLVTQVDPGSMGERAGLRTGDVVTSAGDVTAPSPAALRRMLDQAPAGGAVLVAFVRAGTRSVTALEK